MNCVLLVAGTNICYSWAPSTQYKVTYVEPIKHLFLIGLVQDMMKKYQGKMYCQNSWDLVTQSANN